MNGVTRMQVGMLCSSVVVAAALVQVASAYPQGRPQPPRADLTLVATDSADPVLVGGDVTYLVMVANRGPRPATRVKLVATVTGEGAVGRARIGAGGSCAVLPTGQVQCSIRSLGSKRHADAAITVRSTVLGTLSLSATVSSATPDVRPRNNRVTQRTQVVGLDSVQGRGTRSTAGDSGYPTVATEIDARGDPTTGRVSGTFAIRYDPISSSPARGSDLRGRVVCLSVEGNRAMAAGVVETSNHASYPPGTTVRMAITDNGEPGAGRDTSTAFLQPEAAPSCVLEPVPEQPLIEGDFVVRDGRP